MWDGIKSVIGCLQTKRFFFKSKDRVNAECSALHFLLMCSLFFSLSKREAPPMPLYFSYLRRKISESFTFATPHTTTPLGWRCWRGTSKGSVHNRAGPGPSVQGRGPAASIFHCSGSWIPLREEEPVDSHWHLPELCCCRTPIAPYPHLVKEQKKKEKKETSSAETARKKGETQKA